MKILITKITIVFSLVLFSTMLFAQGLVEVPLTSNPVLAKKYDELKGKSAFRNASITDTINLDPARGFLDDFSYDGPFPDTAKWLDKYVFINREYPKAPVTLGVATFDGLDYNGFPYDFTQPLTSSLPADNLTSKCMNITYTPSDSVYFSFYYQPQGLGDHPASHDSLVLYFRKPGLISTWDHVWAVKGTTLAATDSTWKLVMIPITDAGYLAKGFQFQFRNWATLSGNTDHWNVDYVYLNRNRNIHDTTFEDVSFVYDTPSLINTYTAIPWRHYVTADMKTTYSETIRNNHTATKNTSFIYKIYDNTGTQVNTTYPGGSVNIDPYITNGYLSNDGPVYPVSKPSLNYTIPAPLPAPGHYTIESILNTTPDFMRNNDTVRHVQEFQDYYELDDGTAEAQVGLNVFNSELAEKFVTAVADTLRYIDIFFNPYVIDDTLYSFKLKVWAGGSTPGTVLYTEDTTSTPEYSKTGYNQFIRYPLNTPLRLNAGAFFIGFQQKTTSYIYVGLDRNIDQSSQCFYNVGTTWYGSIFPGTFMMRPVFGTAADFVGIDEHSLKKNSFTVYPDPANDKLYIRSEAADPSRKIYYSVIDLVGRTVIGNSTVSSEPIDISELSEGVYFIRIIDGNQITTNKFIKVK